MERRQILQRYFGYDSFRPGQETLIDGILRGRDVLGVMPTGAGKSICYQVPAMLLPGLTLVISPLISLMKDQVMALEQAGIPAVCLNSTLSMEQYREMVRCVGEGRCKLLYVAPERLESEGFVSLMRRIQPSLVAVDEAHCVSQWGQDFRPSYLKISEFLEGLEQRPVVAAFTATATGVVQEDIRTLLRLQKPIELVTGFDRPNLYFEVRYPEQKLAFVREFLAGRRDRSGIIYCSTRNAVEQVCESLQNHGFAATRYHAGLEREERQKNQEDFLYDRCPIMVATNAFGMGIDKSNVSFVLHFNMPKDIESYYQEAGRAGRDGSPGECVLLYAQRDVQTIRFLIEHSKEREELTEEQRERARKQDLNRLSQMVGYCQTRGCLRSYLLRYFGETPSKSCGNCGICSGGYRTIDITIPAQKILSCVARVNRCHPQGLRLEEHIQVLRGSRAEQVQPFRTLSTYGIMADTDLPTLRQYGDSLLKQGYLKQVGEAIHLTEQAKPVLFQNVRVTIRTKPTQTKNQTHVTHNLWGRDAARPVPVQRIQALEQLRKQLAQIAGVPEYAVFQDVVLRELACSCPKTTQELLRVPGMSEVKVRRYGPRILRVLEEQKSENQ